MQWDGSSVHRADDRGRLAYQKPPSPQNTSSNLGNHPPPSAWCPSCAIIVAQKAKAKEPYRPRLQGQVKKEMATALQPLA